ncbi:MAG: hypothetical protein KAH56_10080 [Candidatus Krumholzibacteria bacterium]|nr:hypothetical protein [Candidatus Krumholzibacteria bacterium]
MAEYTFVDIFATKGLEYMVVLLYFVLFVFFSKNLNSSQKSGKKPARKD